MTDTEPLDLDTVGTDAHAACSSCDGSGMVMEFDPTDCPNLDMHRAVDRTNRALIAEVRRLRESEAKVRAYAEDRAFHARGHLNTVNSGRIASDLLRIVGGTGDERPWYGELVDRTHPLTGEENHDD